MSFEYSREQMSLLATLTQRTRAFTASDDHLATGGTRLLASECLVDAEFLCSEGVIYLVQDGIYQVPDTDYK